MLEQEIPSSLQDLKSLEYKKKMGGYSPHFKGKPQNYWPTTKKDLSLNLILVLLVIAMFTFLCIGLVNWCIILGSWNFALCWSILVILFVLIFIILAFSKSKSHSRLQEKLVKKKIKQQKQQIMRQFLNRTKIDSYIQDSKRHLQYDKFEHLQ